MSHAMDTITTTQIIRDGETIVSSGGNFELGFFSPGNSKNRYVGIWYKKITVITAVWVANREIPLKNTSSGILKVTKPGVLVLLNETNGIIWSTNASISVRNPVARLLDSGNLIVKDANDDNPKNFVWQSFDYPTDTLLPGMKLGRNFINHLEVYLSSWKNTDDPAPGDFTFHCDPTGYPQNVLRKHGVKHGIPSLRRNHIFKFGLVMSKNEVYYHYELINSSIISRFTLSYSGASQRWTWGNQGWVVYLSVPSDNCDGYNLCGAYGICGITFCGCLNKFVPKDQERWDRGDWSSGCIRRTSLDCQNGDVFLKYSGIKLPDTEHSSFNQSMTNPEECKMWCLKNCSCMAYTNINVSAGGQTCLFWFGDLFDTKELSAQGQDIYIRMASSELDSKGSRHKILVVSLTLVMGIGLLGLSLMLYAQKRRKISLWLRSLRKQRLDYGNNHNDESHNNELELPLFDLCTISKATDNFSMNNKIGEGGFGPVYKGQLEQGQEIAVKRLSRTSHQGVDEFKNEVICVAKLQHRNLVKLLGCCIQGQEYLLIYEYMPNKSLDLILFDPVKSVFLDWPKRFNIINGVARGLMYLHQDSRLRIIHRDLKASNILLDFDMNPKISDFGLARSFRGNETGANTSRVVGTYGYMSPEYTIDGVFSVKSDVFSFGVILLEIVSGKRNIGFSHRDHDLNLLGHAWTLHNEGRALELVDSNYSEKSSYLSQVLRSIHIGLLCVQQCPEDRPSMSLVVLMLANEDILPQAKKPGFFTQAETSVSSETQSSINEMSITLPEGR
ncbi:Serine/threonine protein kinase [Handroanthus impetiginosus]|uniref:Receptor-like serine/threonine-protein kinase n=1 Tax=Handroanthus impetiginosus TaxID=429701 RepID=A0A2G9I585_9LAMI|nr:Serine/threonine protein kinase [Handroanthus impetiginosus]